MNIYITSKHQRPFLYGTTDTEVEAARALGFEVDQFIHPGGRKEWAICLHKYDDPCLLKDWQPVWRSTADTEGPLAQQEARLAAQAIRADSILRG